MSTTERERVVEVAPVQALPSTADVLVRAADIIEEWGWHQGYYACNAAGSSVDESDPSAVRFCAWGAIARAEHDLDFRGAFALAHELLGLDDYDEPSGSGLAGWNDAPERTAAEVVARLRKAAENA